MVAQARKHPQRITDRRLTSMLDFVIELQACCLAAWSCAPEDMDTVDWTGYFRRGCTAAEAVLNVHRNQHPSLFLSVVRNRLAS